MDTIMEIVKNLDWTPLFISFKTGIVATVISFFLGLFAARKVIHAGERVKAIADGFLTLPMVLLASKYFSTLTRLLPSCT